MLTIINRILTGSISMSWTHDMVNGLKALSDDASRNTCGSDPYRRLKGSRCETNAQCEEYAG